MLPGDSIPCRAMGLRSASGEGIGAPARSKEASGDRPRRALGSRGPGRRTGGGGGGLTAGKDRADARARVDRLAAEFLDRYRRGDWPRMAEYLQKFPDLEPEIREVFPTLLLRERVGTPGEPESEAPAPGPASRRVGPYDTLLLLGSGGQGDVWLAEDSRLGRRVALKVLPRERSFAGRALERFRREAAITSRLEHPGV